MARTRASGADQPTTDVHAHAMPRQLLEWLAEEGLADLAGLSDGHIRIDPEVSGVPGGGPIPCGPEQHDMEARLRAMDRSGVDVAALSAPPFVFCSNSDDEDLAAAITTRVNDELATFVRLAPSRFLGLGTLPVGMAGAVREADRCLDALGFSGMACGTHGAGRELDDPLNEDVWQHLAGRGTFVLLHPSRIPSPERMADYYLPQVLGYPMETALAVARLIFAGVLERHALTLCLAHGGGCLPGIAGRLDLGWTRKSTARTIVDPPTAVLQRLYYDTAVFDPALLRALVEQVGADQVLLGTDAPFDLQETEPLQLLDRAGLTPADRLAVAGGNAQRLLGSPATPSPTVETSPEAEDDAAQLSAARPDGREMP